MDISILDCTLRDGGYYNNWDFEPELVGNYLKNISESGIDYVELGLRNFSKNGFHGAFAYTTEDFLNSIELPNGPTYGVMVDAKTILESDMSTIEAINYLFVPANKSKIQLVRIAAHFSEVEHCGQIVQQLKDMGYIVGLNLMQAAGKSDNLIEEKSDIVNKWELLDVLYFADSLGNMDEQEVLRIINSLRKKWKGPLGIHTHDNMGKGLANTLAAKDNGVTWLDCTIKGMGRGAGNTTTEYLITQLNMNDKYNTESIYELVIKYFEPLHKKYNWGTNILYFLGAKNSIHPTYIQNLLNNSHYGTQELIGALKFLSQIEETTSFSNSILESALEIKKNKSEISGDGSVCGLFDNNKVLILGNGPSIEKYEKAIEQFIEKHKPIVISININININENLIDYYVISHNSKFLAESCKYKNIKNKIILPKHRFENEELDELQNIPLFDHGLLIKENIFDSNEKYTTIPYDLTSAYLLGVLLKSVPNEILLVGFDGYEKNDIRQEQMVKILTEFNNIRKNCLITSLTPTTYPIVKKSIYAPHK